MNMKNRYKMKYHLSAWIFALLPMLGTTATMAQDVNDQSKTKSTSTTKNMIGWLGVSVTPMGVNFTNGPPTAVFFIKNIGKIPVVPKIRVLKPIINKNAMMKFNNRNDTDIEFDEDIDLGGHFEGNRFIPDVRSDDFVITGSANRQPVTMPTIEPGKSIRANWKIEDLSTPFYAVEVTDLFNIVEDFKEFNTNGYLVE